MNHDDQDPIFFLFLNEIGIIDQLARAKFESVLPDGLRMSQFLVLNHLVRLGGQWSPARLANAFQITKGAITNTLQRLESRGCVKVSANPNDGRGKLVELTTAGRELRGSCIQNIAPLLAEMEKTFGRQQIMNTIPVLQEVRKFLDEERS